MKTLKTILIGVLSALATTFGVFQMVGGNFAFVVGNNNKIEQRSEAHQSSLSNVAAPTVQQTLTIPSLIHVQVEEGLKRTEGKGALESSWEYDTDSEEYEVDVDSEAYCEDYDEVVDESDDS